jgi:hypothetical protein
VNVDVSERNLVQHVEDFVDRIVDGRRGSGPERVARRLVAPVAGPFIPSKLSESGLTVGGVTQLAG